MSDHPRSEVLQHTANVVSAHLQHNKVEAEALPQLIQSVYQTLSGLGTAAEPVTTKPEPAVPVRKSVFPDYIVCLEDGAKMKMLKRYIQKRFGLTPAAYRERWSLPPDYPMVAPSYAQRRSELAHQIGLGRKLTSEPPVEPAAEMEAEAEQKPAANKPAKARARRKAPTDDSEA